MTKSSSVTTAMTYEDHVRAIAEAYDADFKAAEALQAADEHREETKRVLRAARRDFDRLTLKAIRETSQVTNEEAEALFQKGRVELPN